MTARQVFSQALEDHQGGRLKKAEDGYRRIPAEDPLHGETLHMLGLLAHQTGRHDEAAGLIARAIALLPDYPGCYSNLCDIQRVRGRFDEAVAAGRRAIELRPEFALAHNNLGNVFCEMGRLDEALAAYFRTLELLPNDAEVLGNLGHVLQKVGRFDEAIAAYQRASALLPRSFAAHHALGGALRSAGRIDESILVFRRAIELDPNLAEVHYNLANSLHDKERWQEAVDEYRRTIQLRPTFAEAHNNLGNVLAHLDRREEAGAAYRRAVELKPDYANAYHNLGKLLGEQGRLDEAIAASRRAVTLDPAHALAKMSLGMMHLLTGDFEQGWPLYEARWDKDDFTSPKRNFSQPMWDGRPLLGGRVLIHAEQGFGDAIQFVRYAPLVAERGGTVLVECPPELAELFGTVKGVTAVIAAGDPLPPFDFHVPMLSLPLVFQTTLSTIPHPGFYLTASLTRCQSWRSWLAGDGPRLKVGLVWAGRATHSRDRMRSIPLRRWLPILEVRDVDFVSLQIDDRGKQIGRLPGLHRILDPSARIAGFADTAALVSQLDLVIAVDTAVAHLAGALGRPVWVLLPFAPDWRWLLGRQDSPWYPTMRLFRQPGFGDWPGVLQRVTQELHRFSNAMRND